MIGTTELILIIAVIVVLFGAAKIPKIARAIGKARSEFRKGLEDSGETENKTGKETKT